MKFNPILCSFHPMWKDFSTTDHNKILSDYELHESRRNEVHTLLKGANLISIITFHPCSIWVILCIRGLHTMHLALANFVKSAQRKSNFSLGRNRCTVKTVSYLESKQRLGKLCDR
jgi:hypothetical protein